MGGGRRPGRAAGRDAGCGVPPDAAVVHGDRADQRGGPARPDPGLGRCGVLRLRRVQRRLDAAGHQPTVRGGRPAEQPDAAAGVVARRPRLAGRHGECGRRIGRPPAGQRRVDVELREQRGGAHARHRHPVGAAAGGRRPAADHAGPPAAERGGAGRREPAAVASHRRTRRRRPAAAPPGGRQHHRRGRCVGRRRHRCSMWPSTSAAPAAHRDARGSWTSTPQSRRRSTPGSRCPPVPGHGPTPTPTC